MGHFLGTLVILHVICDVIGIAQYTAFLKNIRWRPYVFTVSNFEAFASKFVFENAGNK